MSSSRDSLQRSSSGPRSLQTPARGHASLLQELALPLPADSTANTPQCLTTVEAMGLLLVQTPRCSQQGPAACGGPGARRCWAGHCLPRRAPMPRAPGAQAGKSRRRGSRAWQPCSMARAFHW